MLIVRDLSFSYGAVRAIQDVNLTARAGEVTCVLGRNGAGKTTLLRNIHGLEANATGTITLEQTDLTRMPTNQRVRKGLAYVSQGRMSDFRQLTVKETLLVALEGRADRRRTIPEEIYQYFPKLKEVANRPTAQLSGGEHKQLAIARAMVGDPKAVLLDEPTEGVEQKTIQAIGELLRVLVKSRYGTNNGQPPLAIILVEQNLHFVREFGDCFYWMERGTLEKERPIKELTDEFVKNYRSI